MIPGDRDFLERQMKEYVESWASCVIQAEPASTKGFGLARVKAEGEPIRYDGTVHLNFPAKSSDMLRGMITPGRVRKLMGQAEGYVRRMAGLHPWDAILWRAEPTFDTDTDFERSVHSLILRFRCSLITDGSVR